MSIRRLLSGTVAVAALALAVLTPSWSAEGAKHPYYLTALSDLRNARAQLQRMANEPVDEAQQQAVNMIDLALGEIRKAAIDDGKDINEHAPVDAKATRSDRFHRALELLGKAHEDVSKEEDQADTRGLQKRVVGHIEDARADVQHVIATALTRG
jgi:hypothetical protein